MGSMGSDAAIEAADIVLMEDELPKIVDAVSIAKETVRVVGAEYQFCACNEIYRAGSGSCWVYFHVGSGIH